RARGAGREAGGRHAGLPRERVANLSANVARELVAFEHRYIAENVETANIGRGDDNRVARMNIVIDPFLLRKSGSREDEAKRKKRGGEKAHAVRIPVYWLSLGVPSNDIMLQSQPFRLHLIRRSSLLAWRSSTKAGLGRGKRSCLAMARVRA